MSLYHQVRGVNLATFLVLPALGKHAEMYPRFRDCFVRKNRIVILTRTGGGNREDYVKENQEIKDMPGFICDADDDFDSTFAYWEFAIPKEWEKDITLILNGKLNEISQAFKDKIKEVYPKLPVSPFEVAPKEDSVKEMTYKDDQTPFDDWPGRRILN